MHLRHFRGFPQRDLLAAILPAHQRTGFTLIELLTVLALMGVMVGLATPAMRSLTSAGGLNGGGYQVDNLFASARKNSISKGVLTAVVILTSSDDAASFRTLTVLEMAPKADGSAPDTADWKQVSKWEVLPVGVIIDNSATNSNYLAASTATSIPTPPSLVYKGKSYAPGSGYSYQIFLPSGRLSFPPSPCNLTLAEGGYSGGTPIFTPSSKANYFTFIFNNATGEPKIIRP